jgi:hypothetical protein
MYWKIISRLLHIWSHKSIRFVVPHTNTLIIFASNVVSNFTRNLHVNVYLSYRKHWITEFFWLLCHFYTGHEIYPPYQEYGLDTGVWICAIYNINFSARNIIYVKTYIPHSDIPSGVCIIFQRIKSLVICYYNVPIIRYLISPSLHVVCFRYVQSLFLCLCTFILRLDMINTCSSTVLIWVK